MQRRSGSTNPRLSPEALLVLALLVVIASLLTGVIVKTAGAGSSLFNVMDFGATGDGVTDDADAIQQAVDAAAAVGGTVVIPSGTYVVGSTISLRSRVTLQGQDASLSMANQGSATELLAAVDVDRVTIRDLTIRSGDSSGKVIAVRLAGHTNCVVQNVDTINCYYGLKIDTGGANLTVSNFTATAAGQPIYVSNLNGGSFDNLDLDAVDSQLESYTFHALYVERNNRNLTFRSARLTGGSGFTLQLFTDAGWTSPSSGIAFDDLTVEGRWAVVIASGYQNVSFRNVTVRATQSDEGVFTVYDPRTVTVDGFTASGGRAMLSATDSTQAQGVLFENGAYDGPQICDDPAHFVPDPIGPNVVAGTTPPPVATTTRRRARRRSLRRRRPPSRPAPRRRCLRRRRPPARGLLRRRHLRWQWRRRLPRARLTWPSRGRSTAPRSAVWSRSKPRSVDRLRWAKSGSRSTAGRWSPTIGRRSRPGGAPCPRLRGRFTASPRSSTTSQVGWWVRTPCRSRSRTST